MEKKENREVILSLNHIDITFGKGRKLFKAVSDVSFDIYKGETVSLVGESGSGKTTIGRAVVRINPLSAGYIKFKDEVINGKLPPEEFEAYKAKIDEKIQEVTKEYNQKIAADPDNKELVKEKNNSIKLLKATWHRAIDPCNFSDLFIFAPFSLCLL